MLSYERVDLAVTLPDDGPYDEHIVVQKLSVASNIFEAVDDRCNMATLELRGEDEETQPGGIFRKAAETTEIQHTAGSDRM